MKNTCQYFLGEGRFELRSSELKPLLADEVRIRNMAAGICGTDVHIFQGGEGSAPVKPPIVLGHEYAGEVVEIGSNVSTLGIGDHVTVDPNIYCGLCGPCRSGRKHNCENLIGIGINFDGGFAQYSTVPERQCYFLKPDLPYEVGAMAEPIACCLHGIDLIHIRPGETVLIIGGGAIGLIMVQLARLSGAAVVTLSEPIAMRRAMGLQVGADNAVDPLSIVDRVDVVIECAGCLEATEQAVVSAKAGGRVLLFSVPELHAKYPLPLFDVFKKELTIVGSFINPDTHQRAVNLLNQGRLQIQPIVTHRFPLRQVQDAVLAQMGNESIKVVVMPQD